MVDIYNSYNSLSITIEKQGVYVNHGVNIHGGIKKCTKIS